MITQTCFFYVTLTLVGHGDMTSAKVYAQPFMVFTAALSQMLAGLSELEHRRTVKGASVKGARYTGA